MSKKLLLIALVILIAIIVFVSLNKPKTGTENGNKPQTSENNGKSEIKLTPLTAKYLVEAQLISLENGKAETVAPYGGAKQTTEIVGEPVSGDLNSDGQADYAIIIKQQTANDIGVYYYAAIALTDKSKNLIAGSNAVALGDRIDIKNLAIVNQSVKINYLDWKTTGDDVEKAPTVPVSKSFILDGVMFKELTNKRANAQIEAACTDSSGTWNKTALECKGLSKEWCAKTGGTFSGNTCKF